MTAASILACVLMGGIVGTASGLFGIGGGLLMVPFLYFLMSAGWSGVAVPIEHQAALAHATSLAVIVPTAISGLLAFGRRVSLGWRTVVLLGGTAALTAFAGSAVAASLATEHLKTAFGALILVTGARMWLRREGEAAATEGEHELRWWAAVPAGGIVGFLSALLGVGGGVVAIPILIRWAKMDIRRVAPASIAIVLFAAPAGVLGYVLAGTGLEGMPAGAAGYTYLPAAAALAPGAVLLAPVGARWNQRMGSTGLRRSFAALLILVGTELVWSNGLSPLLAS